MGLELERGFHTFTARPRQLVAPPEQMLKNKKAHSFQAKLGIDRLPGHFSLVLRLHYLEHWSHQDIAEQTGENAGTIKARIHRAKAAFKRESHDGEVKPLLD